MSVLVVLACREGEPGADATLLAQVISEARAGVLHLHPLTRAGVEAWLSDTYDDRLSRAFVDGCFSVTGGNPFLLGQLVVELRAEGLGADERAATRIAGVAPPTVGRSVLARLARLGPSAVAVAESAAILSADARLDRVAALAGLSLDDAGALTDALAASRILAPGEPIRFAHPMLRAAVYEQIPPARRGLGHAAAARRLMEDAAGSEHAATHLLLAPPAGDPATVETLRAAATAAIARGAPDGAAVLLRRALAEPPTDRPEVLLELATAEATAHDPGAVAHAREVVAGRATATQRARAALLAANAELRRGRLDDALEVLATAERDAAPLDEATRLELQATAVMVSSYRGASGLEEQLVALGADDLAGDTPPERLLLAMRAMDLLIRARPRGHAVALVRRVVEREEADGPTHESTTGTCARVLADADCIDEAREVLTGVIRRGEAHGAVMDVAYGSALRSEAARYAGTLAEAEADARVALDIALAHGLWITPLALAELAEVLVEREPPTDVLKVIDDCGVDFAALPAMSANNLILHARGRARAAAGDLRGAVDDLEACGHRQLQWGVLNPADIPWRSSLALVLRSLDQRDEAERLVEDDLAFARAFGAHRALGIALRCRALVGPANGVIDGLEEAVRTLAASPARLEHARALVDLGGAQRRAGRRTRSRETLLVALDAADRCGAHQLSARARAELHAAGARPRRPRLSGPDALTASERRAAELAAEGLTNRQIAQALFVTTKTIEMHLGRAYPKLGISGRSELAAALGHGDQSAAERTGRL